MQELPPDLGVGVAGSWRMDPCQRVDAGTMLFIWQGFAGPDCLQRQNWGAWAPQLHL